MCFLQMNICASFNTSSLEMLPKMWCEPPDLCYNVLRLLNIIMHWYICRYIWKCSRNVGVYMIYLSILNVITLWNMILHWSISRYIWNCSRNLKGMLRVWIWYTFWHWMCCGSWILLCTDPSAATSGNAREILKFTHDVPFYPFNVLSPWNMILHWSICRYIWKCS